MAARTSPTQPRVPGGPGGRLATSFHFDQEVARVLAADGCPDVPDGARLDAAECYVVAALGEPWPEGLRWPLAAGAWQPRSIGENLVRAAAVLWQEILHCEGILVEPETNGPERAGVEAQIERCRRRWSEVAAHYDLFPPELLELDTSRRAAPDGATT